MDLAPDVAEQALDRRVDVLVGVEVAGGILRDLGEARLDLVELLSREEPGGGQAPRVLGRRLAVVRQELGVVGAQELPDLGVESALDPARPRGHAGDYALLARARGRVQLGLERRRSG